MIRLHPIPDADHTCPYCAISLKANGWHIPGMRNLADLTCPRCGREFYGDLAAGQALYSPMLIEKATGVVHDKWRIGWFADWLRDSYQNRVTSHVGFTVEEFRPPRHAVLLNCLDRLYGHCLLKLLNAQYYLDHRSDLDLIILVPRFLRWMVPKGPAAIWTVDLPLRQGTEWNDWLATEIKRRVESLETCWLSVGFSHPHPADYSIERFTGVRPFPVDDWSRHSEQPMVTFVWREDRVWGDSARLHGLAPRLERRLGWVRSQQKQRVLRLAMAMQHIAPQIRFSVAGLGRPGGLPHWIADMRSLEVTESTERAWCELYAQSHVVIGVHGSNMLLPSAHAGAVVELMPPERWGNMLQDLLLRDTDCREILFRFRIVPISIEPDELAALVVELVRNHEYMVLVMGREFCRHESRADVRSLSSRYASLSLQPL